MSFGNTLRTLPNVSNSFMCSLGINSLHTNIPVAETIDLILDNIFTRGIPICKSINRKNFRKLLQLTLTYSLFKIQW